MKISRKLKIAVVVAGLLLSNAAWSNNAELAKIAKSFFITVRAGDKQAMEGIMTQEMKKSSPPAVFQRFLNIKHLDDFKRAEWESPTISGEEGQLKGKFLTSNDSFPVVVYFQEHQGSWLIHGISTFPKTPPVAKPLPSEKAIFRLIKGTMQAFAKSVNKRDMQLFYASTSDTFRIRHGVEELEQGFGQFFGASDFGKRVAKRPKLTDGPTLAEGYLKINGSYFLDGYKTDFQLAYVADNSEWKIISFAIRSNSIADRN